MLRSQLSALFGIGLALSAATQFAAPAQAVLHITEAPGYSINWNGNDGANFNPAVPATVPTNLASTSNGTTPFATSQLAVGPHFIPTINDGQYGNSNSWIGADGDPIHAAGVSFTGLRDVTSIAWGRDNGNAISDPTSGGQPAGQLNDRSAGVYTLQRTIVAAPDAGTAFTGDAATGWETIGTFNYYGNTDNTLGGGFTQFFRHEYDIAFNGAAVPATGLRIVTPGTGIGGGGTAIDEIEAYSNSVNLGLTLVSVTAPGTVPANLALLPGATAFAKNLIVNGGFAPTHTIDNLNDGLYGNENSWIGHDTGLGDPADGNPNFAGIAFAGPTVIGGIAFGRDSDGVVSFADRAAGVYLVQYTTEADPSALTDDSSWITIGSATLDPTDPTRFIRHEYSFDSVLATGVRIVTQNGEGQIAIDEIEVFAGTLAVPEPATMSLLALGALALVRRRRQQA